MSGRGVVGKRARWFEAPLILLVFVVTAARSYIGDDLWFWDEATYLKRGVYPDNFGFPSWVESPAQSGMYGLWSLIFANPIDVYFLGNATSAVVFVVGVWFAARLLGTPITAFLAAVVAASLPLTYIWPHLTGVPAGMLIAAIAILWRNPGTLGRVTFIIAIWLAAAFRPEFTWAATITSLVLSITSVKNLVSRGPGSGPLSPLLVISTGFLMPVLAVLRFGNIWQRSDREWTAFAQHYSLRNPQGSADVWAYASDAVAKDFPGAQSVTDALTSQPRLVLEHVAANFIQTPVSVVGHSVGVESASLAGITLGTFAALFLFGLTAVSILFNRSGFVHHIRHLRVNRVNLILIVVVFIFALVPMLIVYPRPHYQLLFVGMLIVIASVILGRQLVPMAAAWTWFTLSAGLALLMALIASQIINVDTRNARFEDSIRAVATQIPRAVIVTGDKEVDAFLPGSIVVEPEADSGSIAAVFDTLGVNVVVITPLLDQSGWSNLSGYPEFIGDPASLDFREVTPNSNVWVR